MSEEIFEVVDKNNQVIGRETRSAVLEKGLGHRAVYVLLFNSKSEILLQKRAVSKKVAPGTWDFSSAEHLTPGESYESAAIRGLKEELGIKGVELNHIDDVHFVCTYESGLEENEFNSVFVGEYNGKFEPDGVEVSEACFIPLEEVKKMLEAEPEIFAPWVREYLPTILEKQNIT